MNKWIAEFELEDGDTMPEHMDLEYKGAKIDFHCRPKEPILDKIRVEMERQEEWLIDAGYNLYNVHIAFNAIMLVVDKCKAEQETEDGNEDDN